jgi:hypothetical protein
MNSNRLFAVALVVAALAFGAPTAISQTDKDDDAGFRARMPGGQAFMAGPPGRFVHMRMLRALDLTEDQRNQVREFQSEQLDRTKEEREALMDAQKDFQKAVEALETFNGTEAQSELRKAAKVMADKQAALAIASAGQRTEFLDFLNSILDADQWEELQRLRTKMEQFRNGRFERRKKQRQDLR